MRMKLKNKTKKIFDFKKLKLKINSKNFLIFLISFLFIGLFIGILFYIYMNSNDKALIKNSINMYFKLPESYDYTKTLLDSLKNNIINILVIWFLGISIIGIPIIMILLFSQSFSIGFTIAGIFDTYKALGLVGFISYLFPSKILYIFILFLLSFFSIKLSYKLISIIFLKKEININKEIKKYIKILIIVFILSILCSILEVYVTPFMIKVFTFFNK